MWEISELSDCLAMEEGAEEDADEAEMEEGGVDPKARLFYVLDKDSERDCTEETMKEASVVYGHCYDICKVI